MKRYISIDPTLEPNLVACPKCDGNNKYCSYCNGSGQIPEGADIEVEYEDYDRDED